ncbi:hypothetical protein EK21DRAFT_113956 [Setomelanomma holmii]|uniref:Uncharacterized protein n=1 Tax=Setomelanomma holmii TaxID=210430 RepID=A0A9P4LIR8_9PLEO|nr:hypothetical protein EK21DRAFT_113956 [Setomelanomma holmii]
MHVLNFAPLVLAALSPALAGSGASSQGSGAAVDTASLGACAPSSPDNRRCDGNKLQWCKPDGWAILQECSKDQECVIDKDIVMGGECRALFLTQLILEPPNSRMFSIEPMPKTTVGSNTSSVVKSASTPIQISVLPSVSSIWSNSSIHVHPTLTANVPTAPHVSTKSSSAIMLVPIPTGGACCKAYEHRCSKNKVQECDVQCHWFDRVTCENNEQCVPNCDNRGECYPYCKMPGNDIGCSMHTFSKTSLKASATHAPAKPSSNLTSLAVFSSIQTSSVVLPSTLSSSAVVSSTPSSSSVASSSMASMSMASMSMASSSMSSSSVASSTPSPAPISDRCQATTLRCHDNKIQNCPATQHWADQQTCPDGTVCTEDCTHSGCAPYCRNKSRPSALNPQCSEPGSTKCDVTFGRLLKCNNDREWETEEMCADGSTCVNDAADASKASCVNQNKNTYAPPVSRDVCPPFNGCYEEGTERCNGDRAQRCTRNPYPECQSLPSTALAWKDMFECPAPMFCFVINYPDSKNARCLTGKKLARQEPAVCVPDELSCSEDGYRLLVCKANGAWETQKKCATPGDCKVDGSGLAHCERGGIDPPKFKRDKVSTTLQAVPKPTLYTAPSECQPKDRACDSERRFLFECNDKGMWEQASQCYAPGFCAVDSSNEIGCTGFPLFKDLNHACDGGSCEAMDYLYCIGASEDKPEVVKKCFDGMCAKSQCKGCDRCNYHTPYGKTIKPDPLTIVKPGKKNQRM